MFVLYSLFSLFLMCKGGGGGPKWNQRDTKSRINVSLEMCVHTDDIGVMHEIMCREPAAFSVNMGSAQSQRMQMNDIQ